MPRLDMNADAWADRARRVPIEDEIARRGIKLKRVGAEQIGPCPICGGEDRFSINTKKQVFNCRECNVGGNVIALVQHLDGHKDFIRACTTLAGPKPNGRANGHAKGKDHAPNVTPMPRAVPVAEFVYQNADASVAFVVERLEFQNPDGSFVIAACSRATGTSSPSYRIGRHPTADRGASGRLYPST